MIAPPKPDESILHHIFRVGCRAHPLTRKKDEPRGELRKTNFPIFMAGDILHDLFRVFHE
jgi:5'-deoxynucleotidase YfbR-like HD superfamily hydrolase